MTHVTYRVPKSHAALVEKLFAAYQVPCEEMTAEKILREAMEMPAEMLKDIPLEHGSLLAAMGALTRYDDKKPVISVWPDSFAVVDGPGATATASEPLHTLDESSGADQILGDRFHK